MKKFSKFLAGVLILIFVLCLGGGTFQPLMAGDNGCIGAPNARCVVTWFKCVNNGQDCWRETMTILDMTPYSGGADK